MSKQIVCRFLVPVLMAALAFSGCGREQQSLPDAAYVQGFTQGNVLPDQPFEVAFVAALDDQDEAALRRAVTVEPAVAASFELRDRWTLRVTPDEGWQHGATYRVAVQPEELGVATRAFHIDIHVPELEVTIENAVVAIAADDDSDRIDVVAKIHGANNLDRAAIDQALVVRGAAPQHVEIGPAGNDGSRQLRLVGLRRGQRDRIVNIALRKGRIAAGRTFGTEVTIPAQAAFELLEARAVQGEAHSYELAFSHAVSERQNLTGLITSPDLTFQTVRNGNVIELYTDQALPQFASFTIEPGVEAINGMTLEQPVQARVQRPREAPGVRFVGDGTIFPNVRGTTVVIETRNLRQVAVEAVHVNGEAMHQFLQVNQLDGGDQLERVGEVVWRDIVDLDFDASQTDQWVRYGLDVSPLVREHTSGLVQLRVSFRRQHIEYVCDFEQPPQDPVFPPWPDSPQPQVEDSYWDFWGGGGYYNSRRRRDPCDVAFYRPFRGQDITARRNVLVSNLGLLASRSTDGSLSIYANDLRSGQPVRNVEVAVASYQGRNISSGRSDRSGRVEIDLPERTPFYVQASSSIGSSYLRVDPGSALAVSHFDVGGARLAGGVDAFAFGERDVWRPGDDMYLTLILRDSTGRLPSNHPVRLELIDPRGQVTDTQVQSDNTGGFYHFVSGTANGAPTGSWRARYSIGDTAFEQVVQVEAIRPNRLAIEVELGEPGRAPTTGRVRGAVRSEWLHGATAAGLRAELRASYVPMATTFTSFADYAFDDPAREFDAPQTTLLDDRLDENGEANFTADIAIESAPGRVRANLLARVYEPGGGFSTQFTSTAIDPYERYVGVRLPPGDAARGMLLTDVDHPVDVVMLNADGTTVANATVQVEIYKLRWRWWWVTDSDDVAAYISQRSITPIQRDTVRVRNGRGTGTLRINYPQWGRYLIRVIDGDGHSTGKVFYIDWPGWAGRQLEGDAGDAATVLPLTPERPEYEVGQTARVTIPTGDAGRVLVRLEHAGTIVREEWVQPRAGGTTYQFRAEAGMAPNLYVHVTYLQPHQQTENDRPIRTYGVVPISIVDPGTRIAPTLDVPDEYAPGQTATITVRETNGRAMTYTVAVVDEGLLGLTNFQVPNPWSHFYRRLASMVETWDVYDDVAGAFTGELARLLAIGGGDSAGDGGQADQNRFDPVVHVFPPQQLRAGATGRLQFTMPNYLGSVRVMIIAADGSAYGAMQTNVPVRQPVMALLTAPRVLRPGDEAEIPVTVFALEQGRQEVALDIELSGAVRDTGRRRIFMTFDGPGQQQERVRFVTAQQSGTAELRVTAIGGGARSVALESIPVQSAGFRINEVDAWSVRADNEVTRRVRLPGVAGSNTAVLELSTLRALDLERRLGYLIRYPYGCIEQTTSSAFPQLYLDRLVDLNSSDRNQTRQNVTQAIERLQQFRTPSGGFAYWPGQSNPHEWATSYALHFLLEAERAGFQVPATMRDAALDWQAEQARAFSSTAVRDQTQQAYRLYTLALGDRADRAAMNRLRESSRLSDQAAWRLAQSYATLGLARLARGIVRDSGTDFDLNANPSDNFASQLRDRAMALEAAVALGESAIADRLAQQVTEALTSDRRLSTQDIAFALVGMARYNLDASTDQRLDVEVLWNGTSLGRIQTERPIAQVELPVGEATSGSLELRNRSPRRILPRLQLAGEVAQGDERRIRNGLTVTRTIRSSEDGFQLGNHQIGIEVESTVTVRNNTGRRLTNVALSHAAPAGWEILNTRLSGDQERDDIDFEDIRDERVDTFFSLNVGQTKTFRLRATAAYRGSFYLPAVQAEAMYEPEVQALEPGQWITIRD